MVTCYCGFAHSPESATHCKLCGQPLPGVAQPAPGGHGGAGAAPSVGADGREHKLVAEGAPPIPLVAGRTFTIGRAEDSNLPIPSQRVSRHHAEIVWKAGLPVLRSLSETASTLVNGKAVKEHELRDGDALQIGPYECKYSLRTLGAALKPEAAAPMGATMVDSGGDAMAGSLSELSAFALLRMFEARSQTGTLVLRAGGHEGRIVLDKGRVISADAEGQSGKKGLFVLLSWRDGTYSFSLEKKTTGKIFRTFNYNAVGPAEDDFGRKTTISDLLEEAEAAGVEEPLPAGKQAPKPAPAPPPKAGVPRPPAPGKPGAPPPPSVRRPGGPPPPPKAR